MAEDAQAEPGTGSGAEGEDGAADLRAQFREALQRKAARHHASASADPGDDAKAHGGASPARARRQFRRKSG